MNKQILKGQSQSQDNLIKDAKVGRDLTFAPVEIGTKIETQIIQTSVTTEVTQRELNKASPYQGLKRFNLKDRGRFFGRDKLIARLFEAVNRSNLSLVLGASGSGKSSLVRAGLIPELKKSLESSKFYDFIFTPNDDPFESLYRCLLSEEKDYNFKKSEAKIARQAEANTLTQVISTLKKEDERWLIFVDQFEELFTSCQDLDKRNNFIESLVRVANSGDNSVKIVLAMRADFLEQLSSYPDLGAIVNQNNLHLVTDMHPDELRQAIEQPAAKHGVVFEEGLVEQIIKEVEGQKGYLPLLQYTLNLLWQSECRTIGADGRPEIEDRTLNKTTYAALEGVRGALQKQVNEIYHNLSQEEQSATKQVFVKLVNIVDSDSGSKTVSRRANRSEFVGESVNKTLLTFIDENLLVSSSEDLSLDKLQVSESKSSKQSATVEIAHEILLASWDRLKGWIEEEKEAIILKNWLAGETNRWQKIRARDESKGREELLKGSRLEQVLEFRQKDAFKNVGGLRAEENEFIDASVAETERIEREKEARRRRDIRTAWGIAGGSLVAVVISTGLGLMAWKQTKQAELNQADSLARYSLSLLTEDKDLDAFVTAIKAGKILQKHNETDPTVISALGTVVSEGSERNRLVSHDDSVQSVSFSPNGQTLASGSIDKTIKIWDVKTGKEITPTLMQHDGRVYSVSFSPDGQTLASGSDNNGTIKIWDVKTGKEIHTLKGRDGYVNSISFSPDGQTLATGLVNNYSDHSIKIWNLETREEITKTPMQYKGFIESVSFSPDGQTLATGTSSGIKLWDVKTGEEITKTPMQHNSRVNSVSFSPDGQILASGNQDGAVKLWDVKTGEEITKMPMQHDSFVLSMSFNSDGQTLVTGSADNTIKLWNVKTAEEIRTLQGHNNYVNSVSFSPDGKTLVTGSSDKTIKLWKNLVTGKEIPTLPHSGGVESVSFSPDGKTLASGGCTEWGMVQLAERIPLKVKRCPKGNIKLWDAKTGKEIDTLRGHDDSVESVSFSPDSQILASGSGNGNIKLWDVEKRKEIDTPQPLQGGKSRVLSLSFSREILATGNQDGTVKLWDAKTGNEIPKTPMQKNDSKQVNSISFSPDGQTLAIGSSKEIELWDWDVKTGKERNHVIENGVTSVSFSPDGQTLAAGIYHKKIIKLWDVKTEKEIPPFLPHGGFVTSISFSPNGQTLASGSSDSTIKLWDLETKTELLTLKGHDDSVKSLSFNPDGQTLASGSSDGTIKLWDVDLDLASLMERSCNWVRNYLQNNPNVKEEDKHLCDDIGTPGFFLEEGKRLAKEGKVKEAIALFKQAQTLDPDIDLDPSTKEVRDKDPKAVTRSLAEDKE